MCFPHTANFRRQRQKSSYSATKILLFALGYTLSNRCNKILSFESNARETSILDEKDTLSILNIVILWAKETGALFASQHL